MGQPVRIVELAERMIVLSGLEPRHDIDIAFTGIRRGERLMELLFARDEPRSQIGIEGIMAVRPVTPPTAAMKDWLAALERGVADGDRAATFKALTDRSRISALRRRRPRHRQGCYARLFAKWASKNPTTAAPAIRHNSEVIALLGHDRDDRQCRQRHIGCEHARDDRRHRHPGGDGALIEMAAMRLPKRSHAGRCAAAA